MNICVLDDNNFTASSVSQMVMHSCHRLAISSPTVFRFTSSGKFLTWLAKDSNVAVDVCFLDIYLKSNVDGIEIAKVIKNKNHNTLLVFMTAYDHYFPQIVQAEPFRFLSKPFQYEDFHKIFLEVHNRIHIKDTENKCIYLFKNNGITYSVNLYDVISISSYQRKVFMLNTKKENISFYGKLDQVEDEVKSLTDRFLRISKSFMVNKSFIDSIGKNTITLQGAVYKISPRYKDQTLKRCQALPCYAPNKIT